MSPLPSFSFMGVEIVLLNDNDVVKPATEREMLLVVSEKLTTLTEKVDEIRKDNAGKYDAITVVLNKQHDEIEKINKWRYMINGALIILSIIIGWIINLIY